MRLNHILFCGVLGFIGCDSEIVPKPKVTDGGTVYYPDLKCPSMDMTAVPVTPKCAAAKGLTGDNLLCFDFSSVADQTLTTPPPPQLDKWDFEKSDKSCWVIMNGKLVVKNFAGFMSSCGFLMPALSAIDYQKYSSFTLSVVQTLDVNETQQKAQIMMGQDDPPTRLVDQATGKQPRQQRNYQLAKVALPNSGTNTYQPLFKLTSSVMAGGTAQGWQIESIAVMGNL